MGSVDEADCLKSFVHLGRPLMSRSELKLKKFGISQVIFSMFLNTIKIKNSHYQGFKSIH